MLTPKMIAAKADEIYQGIEDSIKTKNSGKHMVVEVLNGEYFIHELPHEAFNMAREKFPYGNLHLIRIGSPAAFKVSHIRRAVHDGDTFLSWPL